MPKKHRLSHSEIVRLPQRAARRSMGEFFSMSIVPQSLGSMMKIACVVSKKNARRAVDRNRIRRVCREAVRTSEHAFHGSILFYAKRTAARATNEQMRSDVARLLQRAS